MEYANPIGFGSNAAVGLGWSLPQVEKPDVKDGFFA
jgi:hypothetical protein